MSSAGQIFLVALVLIVMAPFLAVLSVRPGQTLRRVRYAVLFSAIIGVSLLLRLPDIARMNGWADFLAGPFGVLSIAVTVFLVTRFAAMRAKDAGFSKEVRYVLFVPVAGLFLCVFLLLPPSAATSTKAKSAVSPDAR